MKLTFFEVFGDPTRDGECTILREGIAHLGVRATDLASVVNTQMSVMIADREFKLVTGPGGGIWTGWINPNTRRQRKVQFALLTPSGEEVRTNRIALLHGTLLRGEAIVDIRPQGHDHRLNHNPILCFTRGSRILTAFGDLPVEALRVGDLVHTIDNGLQPVTWIGEKPLTPARIHATPGIAPVRVARDSFGPGLPTNDIWVSPHHRMWIDAAPQTHFNRSGVLAPACGLVHKNGIAVDTTLSETSYFNVMFEEHQLVFVEGLPVESFYPCPAVIETLNDVQRAALFAAAPALESHPLSYGPPARRTLSVEEAAALAA